MNRNLLVMIGLAAMASTPIPLQTAPMQAPAAPAAPMPDPKSAAVPRIDAQVKIDGVLDEQPWQKAARLTPFVHNDTMMPARVGTEVRLWYDQAALYLGWTCEDYDIQATFTQRDSRFWEEEVVEFFVTPGTLDRYFELQWNPLGGTFDAIITNELGPDGRSKQFKGDWSYTAASMTYAVKWMALCRTRPIATGAGLSRCAFPFADLKVPTPQPGDVWRGNFYRFNRDRDGEPEQLSWSPTILPGFHQPARFGYLRFSATTTERALSSIEDDVRRDHAGCLRRVRWTTSRVTSGSMSSTEARFMSPIRRASN